MSELDDALADVRKEGSDPFAQVETDTPASSPEVKEPEGEPEDSLPFHKHPRWVERENELKTLKERDEAREREVAELRTMKEEKQETSEVPDWFRELYGENEFAWKKYQEHENQRTDQIKRSVIEDQQRVQREAAEAVTRSNQWIDNELIKLEAEGKTFDRNKLLNVMNEFRPTDAAGNFDFQKAHRIYEAMEVKEKDPAHSQARKQIADIATGSPKGERKAPDYQTPATLRNRSWGSL